MEIGVCVRVLRNGRWENLDIMQLSKAELETYFNSLESGGVISWAIMLVEWINKNVHEESMD